MVDWPDQFSPAVVTSTAVVKREHSEKFLREKSECLELFHSWNEQDQIDFVEELLGGMCHYQVNNSEISKKVHLTV